MPKGGARVNSGPPPDPNALRRDRADDRDGWTLLPACGRQADAPPWPLSRHIKPDKDDPSWAEAVGAQEQAHWIDAWATPQAVAWERLGWTHDVALYVRWLAMAELGDMKAAGEARQWSDRLGLNPAAMLRNRWKIAPDELGARRVGAAPSSNMAAERARLAAMRE